MNGMAAIGEQPSCGTIRWRPSAGRPAEGSPAKEGGAAAALRRGEPRLLEVRSVEAGRVVLLRVSGPVDTVTTPVLGEALHAWQRPGQRLILDLRGVEYLESPGLRLLLAVSAELQASGGQVRLVATPGGRVERTCGWPVWTGACRSLPPAPRPGPAPPFRRQGISQPEEKGMTLIEATRRDPRMLVLHGVDELQTWIERNTPRVPHDGRFHVRDPEPDRLLPAPSRRRWSVTSGRGTRGSGGTWRR